MSFIRRDFEWDHVKAAANVRKHGVSFDDAVAVFNDERAIDERDVDPDEQRFKITGISPAVGVLVVIYAERGRDRIRIISARKASKHEIERYRQG
ncbi:MAG TPA: BrnT family toxin [Hyphomicrobiaceae bacterium]